MSSNKKKERKKERDLGRNQLQLKENKEVKYMTTTNQTVDKKDNNAVNTFTLWFEN